MKKLSIIMFLWVLCVEVHGQGIYQQWGMSNIGGNDCAGSIFSVDQDGNNFNLRYQLQDSAFGVSQRYMQLEEYNGKFYGTARVGGIIRPMESWGIIFEWDPVSNIYTKKVNLDGTFGGYTCEGLTLHNGKLYGLSGGCIFEWNPVTNELVRKYILDGLDGVSPRGKLIFNGTFFYGITAAGGLNDAGVIFQWDPVSNVYTKKFDFSEIDGTKPCGNLIFDGGKFFGMCTNGGLNSGGVIFEWDPVSNVYLKRIDLTNASGVTPFGSLIKKGSKFYGLTYYGGIHDTGVIFEWDPASNNYTKKIDFDLLTTNFGSNPYGQLTLVGDLFYGATQKGGITQQGVLFEWNPSTNIYTPRVQMESMRGSGPPSALVHYNGKMYGTGEFGGTYGMGTIFEWDYIADFCQPKFNFRMPSGDGPNGSLALYNSKYYGTVAGGFDSQNNGHLFEYDPSASTYIKKIYLNPALGRRPTGNVTLLNSKLYGMTSQGGINDMGVIFEWDPNANVYTKKVDLEQTTGSNPKGSLVFSSGKFYGMTEKGGVNGLGVIFEWDPVSNIYTKRIDMVSATGGNPCGNLIFKNGKGYGLTATGGSNDLGVVFEWDPVTNIYIKKIDFTGSNGSTPRAGMILQDDQFYGMTTSGGDHGTGVIFQWNASTNAYSVLFSFTPSIQNNTPYGNLNYSNGKFYGLASGLRGGEQGNGAIFEWDPTTSTQQIKQFLYIVGRNPYGDLVTMPAPVSKGAVNTCKAVLPVTIDATNNNTWVPIVDEKGDAIAEIKANGNSLGLINTSLYINNATVRENASGQLYMDRNISIVPEVQPSTPIDIRLYLRDAELQAFKTAVNTVGQSSNVNSINEVGVVLNGDSCSAEYIRSGALLSSTPQPWEKDHVLTTTVSSLSSFYFFSLAQGGPVPVKDITLVGKLRNGHADLQWKTIGEYNIHSFDLERSKDGISFFGINSTEAVNQAGVHYYNYLDRDIKSHGVPVVYYRIRSNDTDGRVGYSNIAIVSLDQSSFVSVYPNPTKNSTTVFFYASNQVKVAMNISDNAGRVVLRRELILQAGSNAIPIDLSGLSAGAYFVSIEGAQLSNRFKMIKD